MDQQNLFRQKTACVCYLFEVSMFRNLHELNFLLLSLNHECFFNVVCAAIAQWHRDNLSHNKRQ